MRRLVHLLVILCVSCDLSASDTGENIDVEIEIEVLGLFRDAALLNIAGEQILLKAGDVSDHGILLLNSSSKEAVVKFEGQERTLNLSTHINAAFEARTSATVSIMLNRLGQYRTGGTINDRTVSFLVDTGANIIAMNQASGQKLGVDLSAGRKIQVTTASGMVASTLVMLDAVQVGGITVRNVQAAVMDGEYPVDILLGMSFLRSVEIKESSGVLQLTAKF